MQPLHGMINWSKMAHCFFFLISYEPYLSKLGMDKDIELAGLLPPFGGRQRVFCSSRLWSTVNQASAECTATERNHDSVCRNGGKPTRAPFGENTSCLWYSTTIVETCTSCPYSQGSHTSQEILAGGGAKGGVVKAVALSRTKPLMLMIL